MMKLENQGPKAFLMKVVSRSIEISLRKCLGINPTDRTRPFDLGFIDADKINYHATTIIIDKCQNGRNYSS